MSVTVRVIRWAGIAALFLAAALFGIASGVMIAFAGDLPEISQLDNYAANTSTITRVLGRDGTEIGEFAKQRREIIRYQDIPPVLQNAILSAEDSGFFRHGGLLLPRMMWAFARNLVSRSPGGSTITQQLARNLFPESIGFERVGLAGWERKIKEALVAVEIEKRYTKQEIFTMYCNQTYFNHGVYGVQSASRLFFGKPISDLTFTEAATIAGLFKGPSLSPLINPSGALIRRNYALHRMAEEGYITMAQADAAAKTPLGVRTGPATPTSLAPYFTEIIRQQLEQKYGAKAVYENGLTVKTGLDPALQAIARRALDNGVRTIDKLHGYRRPAHNVLAGGKKTIDEYRNPAWSAPPAPDALVPAVVTDVTAAVLHIKIGAWTGVINRKGGFDWTGKSGDAIAKRGDLIDARIKSVDARAKTVVALLDQPPLVQGAVLALDNRTGQILAMVGGTDFDASQFNRATQALRQVGSAFKPFVYTAAIDGLAKTMTSEIVDEPTSFYAGPNQPLYQPQNYEKDFDGPLTLRQALARSRNVPAVKLMNEIGIDRVIDYAKRFGVVAPLPPVLSLAIGSGDISLMEMTSAYTVFPNQGVRMTPMFALQVTDRDGNVLEEARPEAHEAIRADTAYVMTSMLRAVVDDDGGTAHDAVRAAIPSWPLGGKTGTTDDYTDAWFIGFDPDITLGVWVGYDKKKPLGAGQSGAVAALPIWTEIMKSWVDRRRAQLPDLPVFERPGDVVMVGGNAYIGGTEPAIR